MIISILLGKQIAAMLLMVLMGFALVRLNIMKLQESRALATLTLYVVGPCMAIDAFQVDVTPEKLHGLAVSFAAAIMTQALYIGLSLLLRRPLRLDEVEQCSVIYSNGANLIIPIVGYVFGQDWIFYTCSFITVQVTLFWTHCTTVLNKSSRINIWSILTNINMLSIFAGAFLFVTGIRLPEVPRIAVHSVGQMVGPLCMIVTGMLIGSLNLKGFLAYRKLPLIVALRLFAFPLAALLLLRMTGMAGWVENGGTILLISFFAASAPCASTVTQMAHVYGRDGQYASAINVVSTLLCVVSMPLMAWLFQL
ncbi:MAG: hypothetical protein J6I40_08445 [Mailhella sp.]|nr:hypothetical protein [Mailhella sp.]